MTTDKVKLEGTPQLTVAWSTGNSYAGAHVLVGGELAARLLEFAEEACANLGNGHSYAPDADMEDSTHLVASRGDLHDTKLLDTLELGSSLPPASEKDLVGKSLICYALVVGVGPTQVILVRKRTPIALGTKALVGRMVSGEVTKVTEPLLAFDRNFDVIVTQDQALILNKAGFDTLFRHSNLVLARTPDWVKELASHLPLAPSSEEALNEALQRNQHHRNKFQAILKRDYIKTLTSTDLRAAMKKHGLDPDVLLPGGQLVFDSPANTKQILSLLNEDLFAGEFSGDEFAAGSKRRVVP